MPYALPAILLSMVLITGGNFSRAEAAPPISAEELRTVFKNNPELIFEALEGHEERLYDLLQVGMEKKNKSRIRAERLQQLRNPKIPKPHPDRPVWGNPNGSISIVVFSDFQSASCARADKTIAALLKKYPDLSYRYRHNPLGLHKMSLPAAAYYEALALQDQQKAKKLNHLILQNRLAIKKQGSKKLDELAKKCGADLEKLHRDLKSGQVKSRIGEDIKEARQLGFTASPVFLINGVTVTGAAPLAEFEEVIRMIRSN